MKILVIYSNPPDTARIRLDREDKVFYKLGKAFPDAVIERLHASEVDDVHDVVSGNEYDIIQFSGHGDPRGLYLCKRDISGGELVSARRLSLLVQLAGKDPLVVILLSCYSHSLLSSFQQLAPFVISSRESVDDDACILFVQGFYESLFKGGSITNSFEHGLNVLAARGFDAESFCLTRRQVIEHNSSVFLESSPDPSRDSILINIDAILQELPLLGISQDELSFLLSQKLRIHYWIFDMPRDGALLPIGRQFFGEFSWNNARDVVYCTRIIRLRADTPQRQWQTWVPLLLAYNDMASSGYRAPWVTGHSLSQTELDKAIMLFRHNVTKYVMPLRNESGESFGVDLRPYVEFTIACTERAEDQSAMQRIQQAVVELETALTNFHELVKILQPPEQCSIGRHGAQTGRAND